MLNNNKNIFNIHIFLGLSSKGNECIFEIKKVISYYLWNATV